jgi:hypothetical protein
MNRIAAASPTGPATFGVPAPKFGRAEAPGVLAIIQGIAHATTDDAERNARGAQVLDGLYEQLAR